MKQKTFKDLVDLSTKTKKQQQFFIDIPLLIESQTWNAYAVYVSHRDLFFLTDKGEATYLVDTIGFNHYSELFDYQPITHEA